MHGLILCNLELSVCCRCVVGVGLLQAWLFQGLLYSVDPSGVDSLGCTVPFLTQRVILGLDQTNLSALRTSYRS